MTAMCRITGEILDTAADIRQSVVDILTTPKRTRIMRRAYGAEGFDLVDAPGNAAGALRVIAASADAIARWETRVDMTAGAFARIDVEEVDPILSITSKVACDHDLRLPTKLHHLDGRDRQLIFPILALKRCSRE